MTDAAPPPAVVVLNTDLYFGVQISNVVRGLGFRVLFVRSTDAFVARCRTEAPALGLIDMGVGVDWGAVATYTAEPAASPVLVFGSHLDVDGRRAAKAAGVVRVLTNGDFHKDMAGFITRYAGADAKPDLSAGDGE